MKSHRRIVRRLRRLAIGLAAIAALVPASAAASAIPDNGSGQSANEGAYLRPIPSLSTKQYAAAYSGALNSAAKVGDTPADFPGASRAPDVASPTIEVVRPERTIVRDVDEVLPIALSGAALLIVLMGAAFVLVRVHLGRRHALGRSH
jgi:hypothetical protein